MSTMSRSGMGKLVSAGKAQTKYVSIPSDVVKDSTFPFEVGDAVRVTILDDKTLKIEKI